MNDYQSGMQMGLQLAVCLAESLEKPQGEFAKKCIWSGYCKGILTYKEALEELRLEELRDD